MRRTVTKPPLTHRPTDGIDLLGIVFTLLRHKKFIIIATLGCALIILVVVFVTAIIPPELSFLPDYYRATTTISLNQRVYSDVLSSMFSPAGSINREMEFSSTFIGFDFGEYLIKLIKGETILNRLGTALDVGKKYRTDDRRLGRIRGEILKHLNLEYESKTLTVTLSYEDYDPFFAQNMTNRLVSLLGERLLELKESRNSYQKDLLQKKLAEVQDQLGSLEDKIKELQSKYGVIEVEKLSDEKISMLANLRSQLVLKEMEIRIYQQSARIEDPALANLKAERNNLQRAITELESGFSGKNSVLPSQRMLPEIVLEFSHLTRDLKIQEKIYEILLQEFEITKIKLSLASEEPSFQVLEEAALPDTKVGPNRSIICIVLSSLCFGIICLGVLIYDGLRKKLLRP